MLATDYYNLLYFVTQLKFKLTQNLSKPKLFATLLQVLKFKKYR